MACLVAIVAAYLAIGRPTPFHGYALKAPKSLHGVAIVANLLFWSLMIAFAREIQVFGATGGRAWSVTAVFYYIAAACLLLGWLLYFMGLGGPSAPKDCGEPGEQACPVGSESTGYYLIVIGWLLGMSASLTCHAIALVIASQAAPKPTASAK